MDIFDYIIKRNTSLKEHPNRLSSYRQAAELICLCWNRLDMSFIEPYLSENITWKGGHPYKVISGKENYLKLMKQVFDSLQYSKKSYRADVIRQNDQYYARITVDDVYEDLTHLIVIKEGLIESINIFPSHEWWSRDIGDSTPFGVFRQTSLHDQAVAVAAIEQYIKLELGDKTVTWATPYELRNSHCQLSFTCDSLSYDVLIEVHSFEEKCRFVMASEFNRLVEGSKKIDHVPCILALDPDGKFISLTLLDDLEVRIQKIRNRGMNEWTFRQLFKTKSQLSSMTITKDHRIILPDYNNIEVKMEPLVKAVYFLFLKHPEGIVFKELADYREELLKVYKSLKPMGISKRTIQSIEDVTNPLMNSINEKCARIRAAFVKEFDESLAKNYYIIGDRGEPKKISLPRDLVVWE